MNEFLYAHFIPSVFATGFIVGRSIVDNATAHVGASIVVNIDIKNFFPSITAKMLYTPVFYAKLEKITETEKVKRLMKEQGKHFEWEIEEKQKHLDKMEKTDIALKANLLTKLVTYPYNRKIKKDDGSVEQTTVWALPQGAPTSPCLSNIVFFKLDNILSGLAARNDAVYTRYADDLTFSSAKNLKLNKVIPVVKEFLKKQELKANERKIHVNRRSGRMQVTGLIVNDKVSYGRGRYRAHIRAALHNTKMKVLNDNELVPFDEMHFRGLASYIHSFNREMASKINSEINIIAEGLSELRR